MITWWNLFWTDIEVFSVTIFAVPLIAVMWGLFLSATVMAWKNRRFL